MFGPARPVLGPIQFVVALHAEAPPNISSIPDTATNEDTAVVVSFTVGPPSSAADIVITAVSSNQGVVTDAALVPGGSGPNRTLTITPVANASGQATITVTATNSVGSTSTQFLLTVNPVNDPPTITTIANQTTPEDTPVGPLAFTIGDVETAPGSLTLTRASSNTTLVPAANIVFGGSGANRTVTVTPAANQFGTATITITVRDGTASTPRSFVLTVTAVNDAPTISTIANQSTPEDSAIGPLAFTIGDVETAASALTLTRASSNTTLVPTANIVLGGSGANRNVTITPAPNQTGTSTITITVSDGAASTPRSFVLTVSAVNDAPTISAISNQSTPEDSAIGPLAFTVGDVETAPASLTITGTSTDTTLVPNGNIAFGGSGASRTVTITPAANQSGTATITIDVSDGAISTPTSFVLAVTTVNDVPTIGPIGDVSTAEDTPVDVPVAVGDVETALTALTLTPASSDEGLLPATNIAVLGTGATRTLRLTPAPNVSGALTITVTVADGDGGQAQTSFTLTISAVDDAPTISDVADLTVPEDTPSPTIPFVIGDVDTAAAALTVTATSSHTALVPQAGLVLGGSGASRAVTITPAANQTGTTTITLTVNDGAGGQTSDTFVVTVTPENDAPTITPLVDQSIDEDQVAAAQPFTIADIDTPVAELTLSASSSNTTLVPAGNVAFGGSGPARTVTVTPTPNQSGTATITVTVGDGAATASAQFVVTVDAVNDAPTIAPIGNVSTPEDTTVDVPVTVGDVDTPVASVSLTAASGDEALLPTTNIVVLGAGASRTLRLTPAANASGAVTITVTAGDGGGQSQTTFTLTVGPANDPPTISDLSDVSISEDGSTGPLALTVGDVDSPVAGLQLSATSSNTTLVPPAGIAFGGSGAARTVTITPGANQAGTTTITLTVSDGAGGTASDTVVLTVTAVNDAPTISALVAQTVNEDQPTAAQAFTIDDLDTPPAALTIEVSSSNATLAPVSNIALGGTGASRTIVATPAANQSGTATITVTVGDGTSTTSSSFLLTVTAVNDAPTISDLADLTIGEDGATAPLGFTVGDVDSPLAELQITTSSTNTTLVPPASIVPGGGGAARTVTITPAVNQSGVATITLTVTDGAGAHASDTFVLTVAPVNDAPAISSIADVTIAEDGTTAAIPFTVSDVETAATLLIVSAASSNQAVAPEAGITLAGSGTARSIQVHPAPNANGAATITVTVSDGSATAPTTFVLTVTPVNDAPTIAPITNASTPEDTVVDVPVTIGDIDTALASVTLSATSADQAVLPNASIAVLGSGAGRVLRLTPAANTSGVVTVTATVQDGAGGQAQTSFTLTVTAVNDAPTIDDLTDVTIPEDGTTGPVAFKVGDVDSPVAGLQVTVSSSNPALVPPSGLVLGGSGANRTVTITPAANQHGTTTITLTVSDGASGPASDTFVVTVTPVNDAPTITPLVAQTVNEDQTTPAQAFTVDDLDTPITALTLSVSSSNTTLVPVGNVIVGGTGASRTVTVTPAANQSGSATVMVTVSDGTASASASFTLTVTAVNDAPTISALANQATSEDTSTAAIPFTIGDVDDAPGALTVAATSSNTALVTNASIVLGGSGSARTIKLTPQPNASGQTTVGVTVTDAAGATANTTFVLTVTAVNDAPTISNVADQATSEDTSTAAIPVTVSDLDDAAASLVLTATSSNASLVPNVNITLGGSGASRTVVIIPAANQSGTATITLRVRDAAGAEATDTFILTVSAVNDAPTIGPITKQTIAEDTVLGPVVVTIGDVDDSTAGLTLTAAADNPTLLPAGSLVVGGTGANRTLTVTPSANRNGSASITLTVNDGKTSTTAQFILEVTAVADAPTVTSIPNQQTKEGTPTAPIAFTIGDPDNPADTPAAGLTVSAVSSNTTLLPNANIVFGGSGASRTMTLTPAPNTPGSTQVTVTVSDGALSSSTAFTLAVDAVNDPPTIAAIANQTIAEDGQLGPLAFTVGDIDNPVGSLTVSAISSDTTIVPQANIVFGGTGATRTITITPAANRSGASTITVSVSDGSATAARQFVLTVTAVNDAPTIGAVPSQTTDEDTPLDVAAIAIDDVDNDPATQLTVTATSSDQAIVPNANLVPGGGGRTRTLRITPAANASGAATITVTVRDGQASASTAFQLTVRPVNDAPTVSSIADQATNEDVPTGVIAFTIGDVETPAAQIALTVSSSNPGVVKPAGMVLGGSGASRTITITPERDASGSTTISITADDGTTTTTRTFVLQVIAVNDAPTISALANQAVDEDQPVAPQAFTINDVDTAIDTLTLSASSSNTTLVPAASIALGGSGGNRTVTVTPAPNQSGLASISVTVGDGTKTATATFQLTVKAINDAPALSAIADQGTDEDVPTAAIPFSVGDVDDDPATLVVTATSSNAALVPSSGIVLGGSGTSRTIRLTPVPNASGVTTVIVTATDGVGATASRTFELTVRAVNDAPTVSPIPDQVTAEDTPSGVIGFTVGDLETAATALSVTVESSDSALVPNTAANLAMGGAGASRTLVITPAPNRSGTTSIIVRVQDPSGTAATTSFTLTVSPVNDAPTLSPIAAQTTPEDTPTAPIVFNLGDVDTPLDTLLLVAESEDPALVPPGSIVLGGSGSNRTAVITPAPDANGSATITVKVSDGQSIQVASFSLTVTPVNDAPHIAQVGDQQTPEDTPTAPIPFVIADVDNPAVNPAQGLTLSGTSSDQSLVPNGAIIFGGSGTNRTVTVVPEFGRSGSAIITVTVKDGAGSTASEPFALTVTDVPCTYLLSQVEASLPAPGGNAVVGISTRQSCGWTASSAVPWVTVSAPTTFPAFGEGGVLLAVGANSGPARSGQVTIGGATLMVRQAGLACTYSAQATPDAFASVVGIGNLVVTTTPGCHWSASSNDSWITVDRPAGNSAIFRVEENASAAPRAGTLTVAGQIISIVQAAVPTSSDADGDGLPDAWEQQFGLSTSSIGIDDSPGGDPDHDGVTNLDEYRQGTHPRGFNTRFLAEGANSAFFSTLIALANPDPLTPARVLLRLLKPPEPGRPDDASVASQFLVVPALSRRTVEAASVAGLGATAFSTTIESDVPVVVDRTMSWDQRGYGAHSESSIASPRSKWYFAEGATHSNFDLFYLLQNPSLTERATVRVTYLRPFPLEPITKTYGLDPGTRNNIWVDAEEFPDGSGNLALANTDVSAIIEVLEGPPITAERAMYLSNPSQLFLAGHDSAGIPEPATDWFLAEGSTEGFFDEFVLIANPNPVPARIRASFLLPDGRAIEQDYTVGANNRFNIWLNAEEIPPGSGRRPLADTAVSTVVQSLDGVPVIVERAMWWPKPASSWTEAHNAAGTTTTGTKWAMAEGEVGGPRRAATFILVANPSPQDATVKVTLLFESGFVDKVFVVRANSRFNVDVGGEFGEFFMAVSSGPRRFGAIVESVASGSGAAVPIVVERAMYWDSEGVFWAAGANATATKIR